MGKNVTRVGENGDGQTTKVANQIIVALTIEAVAEGLLFASKAGADPVKVRQALMGGLATSRILNRVYFEKRSFSSSGSRVSLTQRRSAMTKGSRFRRPSKSAARWVRSSALAWQW